MIMKLPSSDTNRGKMYRFVAFLQFRSINISLSARHNHLCSNIGLTFTLRCQHNTKSQNRIEADVMD